MNGAQQAAVERALSESFEDLRLSRGERNTLAELVAEVATTPEDRAFVRNRAFDLVRAADLSDGGHTPLGWLENVMKLLTADATVPTRVRQEAHFSPGDACRTRIASLLDGARKKADICVFTITDDRISERVLAAHQRGVQVRVITDNDKSLDQGSDASSLERRGVPLRVDRSEHHMHHKYAIFDDEVLLTGSYNWTRSAARYNRENVLITYDTEMVSAFGRDFDQFWRDLERWSPS